MEVTETNN